MIGPGDWLYVTANQLERQASYQGPDERQKPYEPLKTRIDAKPTGAHQ